MLNMMVINDYTDLVKTSAEIRKMCDFAIKNSERIIEKKKDDIVAEISVYIHQTLLPILKSDFAYDDTLVDTRNKSIKIALGNYYGNYKAQLWVDGRYDCNYKGGIIRVMFSEDGYFIESKDDNAIIKLMENWTEVKAELNRNIERMIENHNREQLAKIEKQIKKQELFENFRV